MLFLQVAVRGVSPVVWRRLRIAANTSLAALHYIIQIVQGWGDDHLHHMASTAKDSSTFTTSGL
ncbi:plasmid pRiA4b ORF-3 family protein [Salmonella enterica subsp. enterica serovar Montevideo]